MKQPNASQDRALHRAGGVPRRRIAAARRMRPTPTARCVGRAPAGAEVTVHERRDRLHAHRDRRRRRQLPLPVPAGRRLHARGRARTAAASAPGRRSRVSLGNTTTVNLAATATRRLRHDRGASARSINRVDVTSTESATNITARGDRSACRSTATLTDVALLAPGVSARRHRVRRHLLRRLVGGGERGLHQRPQRHRLLQPHRLLLGAVRVLRGSSRSRPAATRSSSAAPPAA